MRKLFVILCVVAVASPLAACIDGLTEAVENIAGVGTSQILEDIDAGIAAGEVEAQSQVDAWVAAHENSSAPPPPSCDVAAAEATCTSQGHPAGGTAWLACVAAICP
jgi:hypothetical protein